MKTLLHITITILLISLCLYSQTGGIISNTLVLPISATTGQIYRTVAGSPSPTLSTATYPATAGTNGNCMTSDGTNWTSASCGAGGGATTSLNNLASVAINTALLTGASGIDAGSTAKPFRNLFFYGAGTFGTTYMKLDGTPTSTRTWTFQDASDTVVGRATTDTLSNKTFTGKTVFASTQGTVTGDTDGATITFDLSASNIHTVTLAGNRTLALSNHSVGQVFTIVLVQDGTGSRTVTWFTTIKWAGGSAPTLTTTASKADMFTCMEYSSNNFYCTVAGQSF